MCLSATISPSTGLAAILSRPFCHRRCLSSPPHLYSLAPPSTCLLSPRPSSLIVCLLSLPRAGRCPTPCFLVPLFHARRDPLLVRPLPFFVPSAVRRLRSVFFVGSGSRVRFLALLSTSWCPLLPSYPLCLAPSSGGLFLPPSRFFHAPPPLHFRAPPLPTRFCFRLSIGTPSLPLRLVPRRLSHFALSPAPLAHPSCVPQVALLIFCTRTRRLCAPLVGDSPVLVLRICRLLRLVLRLPPLAALPSPLLSLCFPSRFPRWLLLFFSLAFGPAPSLLCLPFSAPRFVSADV